MVFCGDARGQSTNALSQKKKAIRHNMLEVDEHTQTDTAFTQTTAWSNCNISKIAGSTKSRCVLHAGGRGHTIALKKFQTSAEETLLRGLYLMRVPGPPSNPSNTGSTCSLHRLLEHASQDQSGLLLNTQADMSV